VSVLARSALPTSGVPEIVGSSPALIGFPISPSAAEAAVALASGELAVT
jgi:hypothetical protein